MKDIKSEKRTTVTIVDDQQLWIDTLQQVFRNSEITCVASALNGEKLLQLLKNGLETDVILLDLEMPVLDGNRTFEIIRRDFPEQKVIITTQFINASLIENYLKRGANGYIPKFATLRELIVGIKRVAEFGAYLENIDALLKKDKEEKSIALRKQLFTSREMQVIKKIIESKTNVQIADEVFISIKSIELDRKNIYRKAGVSTLPEFLNFAHKAGWHYLKHVAVSQTL